MARANSLDEMIPLMEDLQRFSDFATNVSVTDDALLERPMYGTTVFVAQCVLDTLFGRFTAYVFQDIIIKNYVVALAYGDIHAAETLFTRLHSSCVTSETLRGADCDCVQQLNGAFKRIAAAGAGVLFYLIQEGRGTGYVPKARDRMIVQSSHDTISTFDAYKMMGLRKDYRDYRNVRDICFLLNLRAPWIVLTNNPDKVNAMRELGLRVSHNEPLEFDPGPFNLSYLVSKAKSGHQLINLEVAQSATGVTPGMPPEEVVLFRPAALPSAQRFIYSASYFLPVRPVANEVCLTAQQFAQIFPASHPITEGSGMVLGYRAIRGDRFLVKIDEHGLLERRRTEPNHPWMVLLGIPYWFRVHVYYDVVTSLEFVVLTYGKSCFSDADEVPIVRVHSEALFNRFPLTDTQEKIKYMAAVRSMVEAGAGVMILLYNDGRGAGFGAYSLDRMLQERGIAASSSEAYSAMGVNYDSRDYDAAMTLLLHHVPHKRISVFTSSPSSLVAKPEFCTALKRHEFHVESWIFIDERISCPQQLPTQDYIVGTQTSGISAASASPTPTPTPTASS